MLKNLKYRQLVFIHSSDTDGRALLGRFQTKTTGIQSDDQEVKVKIQKCFILSLNSITSNIRFTFNPNLIRKLSLTGGKN